MVVVTKMPCPGHAAHKKFRVIFCIRVGRESAMSVLEKNLRAFNISMREALS